MADFVRSKLEFLCEQIRYDHGNGAIHLELDVVFDEHRERRDIGPADLAILRKMTLNSIERYPSNMGVQRKRNVAGWYREFLLKLVQHVD